MEAFIVILFIVIGIVIFVLQGKVHERKITQQIKSVGGRVIIIERKLFTRGPFILVGKGISVYRIEYKIGQYYYEGWVKFGGIFGPDWRL